MNIGENIRRLREERKLTQEQVAEALDVSFQAISSWERDEFWQKGRRQGRYGCSSD